MQKGEDMLLEHSMFIILKGLKPLLLQPKSKEVLLFCRFFIVLIQAYICFNVATFISLKWPHLFFHTSFITFCHHCTDRHHTFFCVAISVDYL